VEDNPPPEVLAALGVGADQIKFYKGKGCASCNNTGYKGRVGIYEALEVDDDIRRLIVKKAPYEEIMALVTKKGMITLRQDALMKAAQGLTSLSEVIRVSS
jgi:type IV pilus assembly protein PilB